MRINERANIPDDVKPGRNVKPFNTHRQNVISNRNRTTNALLAEERNLSSQIRDTKRKCIQRLFSANNSRGNSVNNFTLGETQNLNEPPNYEATDDKSSQPRFLITDTFR